MAERIEAEITLGYREFVAGVDQVVRESARMGQGVEKGLNQTEQSAKAAFAAFSKAASVAGIEYQQFAKKVSDAASSISLGDLEAKFSGLAQKGTAAFASVLESGGNFQEGLLRINTIAGLSQDQLAGLGDQLKNVGKEIGVSASPTQTLASYYDVLSSGFTKTADATKVLQASLKLASGGQAEASDTTRALTGVLNAYGDTSEKAQLRADQFFQTVNLGVTTIPELSKSLGLVTSTAASAGVSFEELSAAIATATLRGQTTSAAIEGIRGVIGSIISPTAGASKEFARLGITVNASTLQQKGLLATLQEIRTASGGQIDSINKIIEGQVGLATALALSKDGGVAFKDNLDQISQAAGASDKALGQVNQGVNESSKAFAASVERLKISAAEAALPIQKTLLDAMVGIVGAIDAIPGPAKTGGLALIGLGTAAAVCGAGLAGLAFTLPIVQAQMLAIGSRVGPLAASAFMALNIPVTVAVRQFAAASVAMAKNALAAGGNAIANFSLAGSWTALNTSVASGTALISGVGLGLAAVALAAGALANEYLKLEQQVNSANEAMVNSEDLRNSGRKIKGNVSLSNTELFSSTAGDLAKKGVTTDDVTQRIKDQSKAAELAREQGNLEQERKAKDRLKRLRVLRTELAAEIEKLDVEAKKPPVIKEKKSEKEEAKEKRAADKLRKEQVAENVQDIENSKRTNEQKIQGLQQVLQEFNLVGSERRAIEDKIFALEKSNATEKAKLAEKERVEKVKDAIQDIENSRATTAEKIQGLKDVLTQHKVVAAERRSIEDKITALEKKDAQAQAKAKKDADRKAAKDQLDAVKADKKEEKNETDVLSGQRDALRSESELAKKRQDIIQDLATAGAASQFEVKSAIEQTLKIRLQEIEIERQLAVQQAKTSDEVAAADKRAAVQRAEAQAENQRAIEKTTEAMKAQKKEASGATSLNLGGGVYSLGDLAAQSQGFLDITKPTTKKMDPKELARQRSILNAIDGAPSAKTLKQAEASGGAVGAAQDVIKRLELAVTLFDQSGNKIPSQVRKASVDGKNTEVAQLGRGM